MCVDPEMNPSVEGWVEEQMKMFEKANERLRRNRSTFLQRANRGRIEPQLDVGDFVLVHKKRFPQYTVDKLGRQWFGPFKILDVRHNFVVVSASPRLGGKAEVSFTFLKRYPLQVFEDDIDEDDVMVSAQDEERDPDNPENPQHITTIK